MPAPTPGKIYLADQRGFKQTDVIQQYSTFNYAGYYDETREAFGALEVLNDSILAAGKHITVGGNKASFIILVPITGQLIFRNGFADAVTLDVGEVYVSYLPEGDFFELTNPYDTDWINFLHLQITATEVVHGSISASYIFDFEQQPNQLIPVLSKEHTMLPFDIQIGQFAGRTDAFYELKNPEGKLFAFVIAGAFEVQGRLMHQRDGLALWELDEADLEALSNNAVILLLEF